VNWAALSFNVILVITWSEIGHRIGLDFFSKSGLIGVQRQLVLGL